MKVNYKEYLGKTVNVVIDRPLNSLHPKFKFRYELNYGFIPNTKAEDDEEIDVYILDEDKPILKTQAKVIAIIKRDDDNECKLVATTKNGVFSDEQILTKVNFVEKYFKSKIVR